MAASVESLYKSYDVLSKESCGEEEKYAAFQVLLNGAKAGEKEKRLSSQFLSRFFKLFPDKEKEIFNVLLDLCEDDEVTIRKQVVHDLPGICKAVPDYTAQVADILVQLLQTDDHLEQHSVQLSLTQLLELDAKSTIEGIFRQIESVGTENSREKIIKYLGDKIKTVHEDKMKPDLEEFITTKSQKILNDASQEEFIQLVNILSSLKSMSSLLGRQKLVDLITEQASEAANDFKGNDPVSVARFLEISKQAIKFLSKNVHAGPLLIILMEKVLPKFYKLPAESSSPDSESPRLSLLRVLAELSGHPGPNLENPNRKLALLMKLLLRHIPEPPSVKENNQENNGDSEEKPAESNGSDLPFSELECLLYAFHQLGRLQPTYLVDRVEDAKTLRHRLQYLGQQIQLYTRSLKEELVKQPVKGSDLRTSGDDKIKVVAYKVTNNIHTLIRELFKNPPSFKATIILSWVKNEPLKRSLSDEPSTKTTRPTQIVYEPPKVKSEPWDEKSRQNRNRGGYGRGRGRGNYNRYQRW